MKKLLTTLCIGALACAAYSQGTVNFANNASTLVSTNAAYTGGGTGTTATNLGGFSYALFTAASTVTTAGSALDLLTPTWTFTTLTAANTATASGGRLNGGAGVVVPTGWPAGVTNSFLVAGWSSNLGTWANVQSLITGGSFATSGGSRYQVAGNPAAGSFLGISAVSFGASGGGTAALPSFSLFGSTPTAQGTPLNTGFALFPVVAVPEPSSFALAGLGAAALMIFRRRK